MENGGIDFRRNRVRRALALAALLGLAGALPGCQVWNAWLDMLKWRGSDMAQKPRPGALPQDVGAGELAASTSSTLIPRVTVYRITVPVGEFSGNDKIWSQLNEDAIDSKTSVLMAQNGLRAATGSVSHWPDIAKMLDTPGASNDQILMQTDGRSSINVVTRPNVSDQIVVSVDRDLQQEGRTFERCDNGFRLSMRGVKGKAGSGGQLEVQLEPIVALGTMDMIRSGTSISMSRSSFSSEEGFDDLRMAASLTANDFLVVTAMDPKSSPFSVGTLWLSDPDKVPATETVLVFVPAGPAPADPARGTKTISETKKNK